MAKNARLLRQLRDKTYQNTTDAQYSNKAKIWKKTN